jgi:nucleotide-binding universal stress UspA family protein
MTLIKKILFPVDLSEAADKIVPYVQEIMDKFGAELHLIHASNLDHYYAAAGMPAAFSESVPQDIQAQSEKRLREFLDLHFKDLPVQMKVLPGIPGTEIIQYTEEQGIDLVVMGHSSTGLARAVFGSVAGHVVKHSPAPVLIVSPSILENKR